MARTRLSSDDEERMIQEAEAAKDAGADLLPSSLKKGTRGTIVVSVRLPMDRATALRDLAAQRGESLSELMDSAVDALLATRGPVMYMSKNLSRIALTVSAMQAEWGQDANAELTIHTDYEAGGGTTTLSPIAGPHPVRA